MKANIQETKKQSDYFNAGKMQIIVALLAYMQGMCWFNIREAGVAESGRLSAHLIAGLDWTAICLMALAIVPLLRGVYLIRKSRLLGHE